MVHAAKWQNTKRPKGGLHFIYLWQSSSNRSRGSKNCRGLRAWDDIGDCQNDGGWRTVVTRTPSAATDCNASMAVTVEATNLSSEAV